MHTAPANPQIQNNLLNFHIDQISNFLLFFKIGDPLVHGLGDIDLSRGVGLCRYLVLAS